jgi:hypothetical protein
LTGPVDYVRDEVSGVWLRLLELAAEAGSGG